MASGSSERRLAAIMFSDIVGYTALMAKSEERGLAARERHRTLLGTVAETYGGQVVDENGDELVLVFPSAADAVNCALAVQAQLRVDPDLALRLGIHSGDVTFDGGRIYGDGVNVASRIRPLAQAGGICVSNQVYDSIKNQANVEVAALGAKELKNVECPVTIFAVSGTAAAPRSLAGGGRRRSRLRTAVWGAAAFAVLLGGLLFLTWPTALGFALDLSGLSGPPVDPPLPDGPSIVVLPFTNMSDDPQQEYFSDGITEDLTTALSSVSHIFVIARNSAFTYKGKAVNVADVGRELGVRYVLEGSVRKAGDRVRITAQLVDAPSGFHVWGEKYDRDLADIFALQSEITAQILAAVQVEIGEADMARLRRKPTESLGAYDVVMRGMSHFLRFNPNDNVAARGLFEGAIELDPGFAAAHAALAATYTLESSMGWSFDPSLMDRAEALARQSIDLDPSDWPGHTSLAAVSMFRGHTREAIASVERAIEINPNNDLSHAILAGALLQNGRMLAATQAIKRAIRLNPRAPSEIWVIMAYANIVAERYDEGTALLEQVWSSNHHMLMAGVGLAVQYEFSDRHEDAQAIAQQILRINPEMTAEAAFLMSTGGARVLSDESTARNVAKLRLAGLP